MPNVTWELPKGFRRSELELIENMKKEGVIAEFDPGQFQAENGTVFTMCSDGDRAQDTLLQHIRNCEHANCKIRPHLIAFPGAPFLISPRAPGVPGISAPLSSALIFGIKTGPKIKEINTVVLNLHWPCGMAFELGLDLIDVFNLGFAGKVYIKEQVPEITKVIVDLHVDFGNKVMRTYHASKDGWESFSAKHKLKIAVIPRSRNHSLEDNYDVVGTQPQFGDLGLPGREGAHFSEA